MITLLIRCHSGNSWHTGWNGTLAEAVEYYVGKSFVTHEDENTGKEIKDVPCSVELVP